MTKKLLLAICLLISGLTYAQDLLVSEVPPTVLNSFNKSFPKATRVEWERKGDLYNVEFDVARRDNEVWLNDKGAIVKHKKELRSSELPAAVFNTLKQSYKGFRIDDVDRYEEAKKFYYKVELKKLLEERKVVLDQSGKVINKVY
ncbi:PepSY-like domain-containing protein [Pedobacter foliorum]|uniref:PepSY-like domain-containing protein n=1 Tax=Pedobacter foliorum TaxID=2739058 RepID=UPI0015635A11|nr:PepSY-like domain-containing protein [Pedobacter foliorum]NRF37849.1 PepSY-like domain-containing protein [Pedobacter foliorum]